MTIPEKLLEVLRQEGVTAIGTVGPDGPHMVNTWNSYIQVTEDGRLLIPAGGMLRTEDNVALNSKVLVTLGSKAVEGKRGPGTGFLIKGSAAFKPEGPEFDLLKGKFVWLRSALVITVESAEQTL